MPEYKIDIETKDRKVFIKLLKEYYAPYAKENYNGNVENHLNDVFRTWTAFCIYPIISVILIN
jgi:hypothetical protein